MSKATKIWLITAASLVLIGCLLFGGMMSMLNWDFTKLYTVQYETNEHEIADAFKGISIETTTADIVVVPCEDERATVVCRELKNAAHAVAVQDGVLVIKLEDTRKWYEHIEVNFGSPSITVSVPKGEYGALSIQSTTSDVKIEKDFRFESMEITQTTGDAVNRASVSGSATIKTTTGDIVMENAAAGALALKTGTGGITVSNLTCANDIDLQIGTGKAHVSDLTCQNLCMSGRTGDVALRNAVADELLSAQITTGDVIFDACDAAELFVKVTTGDVKGSLLSDKVFVTKTTTGDVDVPNTAVGGKCEITTVTGDIEITVA